MRLRRHHLREALAPEAEQRLESLGFDARSNERGFFQLREVPPGVYTVIATLEGMAPATVEGVEVRPGLEAAITEPLQLARPVRFSAEITPASDPYGQAWRVTMSRHDSEGLPVGEEIAGVAGVDGHFARSGVPPGTYWMRVSSADGGQWYFGEVTAGPLEPPVMIQIPLLEIEGTLALGDEPLTATLWFGGRSGSPRVSFDTDLKGRFEGLLPRPGKWAVDLSVDDPFLQQSIPPVEVEEPEGGGTARIEIVLPDTSLAGEVVDESGRPLPGASVVVATGRDRRTQAKTNDRGAFTLRGLSPGAHAVRASAGERTSGWVTASVAEKGESTRLRLVASKMLELHGTVISPSGPVPGTQVVAIPALGSAGISSILEAVSDPLGRFRLTLPATTPAVTLLVFPPGNALRVLHFSVEEGRPLEIRVQPSGATLVLELPGGGAADSPEPLLGHGGAFTLLGMLSPWIRLAGAQRTASGGLVLPEVEPGDYTFCLGDAPIATATLTGGGGAMPPGCAAGTLAPYSTLTLSPRAREAAQ